MKSASDASDALFMLGGIEGLSAKLDAQLAQLAAGKTVDASSFGDAMFSDEFIDSQALVYGQLSASGLDFNTILNVGLKSSEAAISGEVNSDLNLSP